MSKRSPHGVLCSSPRSFGAALVALVALLLPAQARALYPVADCQQVAAIGQTGRPALVRATAVLRRIDGGDETVVATVVVRSWSAGGNFLVRAPWGASVGSGVHRASLEIEIFDGAMSVDESDSALATWPAQSVLHLSEVGAPILCGVAAPSVASLPPTVVEATTPFTYQPLVVGTAGAANMELVAGPDGMSFDGLGFLTWIPEPTWVGPAPVIFRVADELGGASIFAFELTVAR